MLELFYQFIGLCVVLTGFAILWVGAHVQEEQIKGEKIPLPWEKGGWMNRAKRKIFDKSDIIVHDHENR